MNISAAPKMFLGLLRRVSSVEATQKTYFYERARGDNRGSQLADRWADVAAVADLRPTDQVLDVGCAEGLVALAAAERVSHVHGFERMPHRVEAARAFADEAGITNATFEEGCVLDYPVEPLSYDVVFFLGVYGVPTSKDPIGLKELAKYVAAARRQIIIRVEAQEMPESEGRLDGILGLFDELGFDGICFTKRSPKHGNIILGSRRGVEMRPPEAVPELVLLPGRFAYQNPLVKEFYVKASV
jgi:SAM-dependent methyltransferase